jgi:hypothetical protein
MYLRLLVLKVNVNSISPPRSFPPTQLHYFILKSLERMLQDSGRLFGKQLNVQ